MIELLSTYTPTDIIIIITATAMGVKGFISFTDWGALRLKAFFLKDFKNEEEEKEMKSDLENHIQRFDNFLNVYDEHNKIMNKKIDGLIESDKDSIKSFITREHHYFCYQKGWIDDYSLDCLEKRFVHYQKEGGNSFIEGLMDELRALNRQPTSN